MIKLSVAKCVRLQRKLKEMSKALNMPLLDPGRLDGIWGPMTERAFAAWKAYERGRSDGSAK